MKTKLIFNTLLFLLITNFVYTQNLIVGEWKKIDTCPDGNSIIQNFKDDGTGTVIVPDCNKVCAPYYYKYEFLWSTSGSKLTVNYQSVAEYCGKKAPVPPTDVMDYEVSENNLRIVQDRYVRNGSSSEKQNSSTNAKVELANKISEEYNLAPEHSELLQIIASSNSKEELLSKLKAKNQELYTETAMKAVNKLFGNSNIDLPISISEMTQIANGNIEEAINQINRNADISRITEGFGGNEVLANQLYDGMQMTIDAIDEKWEEKAEEKAQEFVNYTKQFKISNNRSSSSKKFEYRANFLDENWKFYKNDFIQITEYDSLKINVNIKKKIKESELKTNDFIFAEFSNSDFDFYEDFSIEFQIGFNTKELKGWKPSLAFFVSQKTKASLGFINHSNILYSFTPIMNVHYGYNKMGKSSKHKDFIHKNISISHYGTYLNETWTLEPSTSEWIKSFAKDSRNRSKIAKKRIKEYRKNNIDKIYMTYRLIKENGKIYLETENKSRVTNEIVKARTKSIEFEFLQDEKLYFGIAYFLDEGVSFEIRNFKINQ